MAAGSGATALSPWLRSAEKGPVLPARRGRTKRVGSDARRPLAARRFRAAREVTERLRGLVPAWRPRRRNPALKLPAPSQALCP